MARLGKDVSCDRETTIDRLYAIMTLNEAMQERAPARDSMIGRGISLLHIFVQLR